MSTKRLKQDLSGQTLGGRYKIEEAIGSGGFASVYRAVDPRVRKFVAIKVLHPEHTRNITDVERFRNEAAIAGRIDDNHFVRVSDFFQDGEHFCFVMEYLQGLTLREEIQGLKGKPMPWPRAFKLARQICAGLDVAHSHDVVHRDIKPENIFIVRTRSGVEQVKLLDLGVAKILQDHYWSGLRNNLSSTGDIIGSPCYIAPEVVQGARVCDPRVDIYSLGIVLYEMVAGVVPFIGSNAYETMYHHVHTEPTRPTALIEGLGLPRPLEDIILCAISKEPEKRFRTVREMDAAIHHELDHQGGPSRNSRPAQIMPAYKSGMEETAVRAMVMTAAPADAYDGGARAPVSPPRDHEGATTTKRPQKTAQVAQAASGSAATDRRSSPAAPASTPALDNDHTPPVQGTADRPKVQTLVTSPDVQAVRSEDGVVLAPPPVPWQALPAPLHGGTWAILIFLTGVSLFATLAVGLLLMKTISKGEIDPRDIRKASPEFLVEPVAAPSSLPDPPPPPAAPAIIPPSPAPVPTGEIAVITPPPGEVAEGAPRRPGKRPPVSPAKPAQAPPLKKDGPVLTMASIAARAATAVRQNCRIHYMSGASSADYLIIFKVDASGTVTSYDRGKDLPTLADDDCVMAKVFSMVKDFRGASDLQARFEYKYKVVQ